MNSESTPLNLVHLHIRSAVEADLPALEWEGAYRHFRRVYADAFQHQQKGLSRLWLVELPGQGVIGQVFVQFICDRHELADGSQRAYLYAFRVKPQYRWVSAVGCWNVSCRTFASADFTA